MNKGEMRTVMGGEVYKTGEFMYDKRRGMFIPKDPTRYDNDAGVTFYDMGGTVGSIWSPESDTAVISPNAIVRDYVTDSIRTPYNVNFEHVAKEDSRNITGSVHGIMADRAQEQYQKHGIDAGVYLHGTYTKADSARYLENASRTTHPDLAKATNVFMSAMTPLSYGAGNGDAAFNIGYALMTSRLMKNGVWGSANGRMFEPENFEK